MTTRNDLPMPPAARSLASHRGWNQFVPLVHVADTAPFISSPPATASEWRPHVAAALATWDRLSASELLQSNGHIKTLAALIRDRYSLSRAEADQQVRRFLREQTG